MKCFFNQPAKLFCMVVALLFSLGLQAQEADNEFTLDAQLVTRGELRAGGFKGDSLDAGRMSHFVLGKYRITADYKRSWLEVKLSPQFSGIWGQRSAGLNLYEGWVKLQTKNSLFVQIGRQELDYETDIPMEFSPIDEVAKAIVTLSETPQQCCLFHPYNNHYVHFGDVLAELAEIGKATRQVENEVFIKALETAKQDPEKAKLLSSLIAYEDMAHGQKAVMIPTDNHYTSQVLYRLGFRWSSTSWDYVDQMLTAISGFGYFEM